MPGVGKQGITNGAGITANITAAVMVAVTGIAATGMAITTSAGGTPHPGGSMQWQHLTMTTTMRTATPIMMTMRMCAGA